MKYDFSSVYNRYNTGSFKWNDTSLLELSNKDGFPFSVADMEFKTAPEIIEAIREFSQKGFFCYTAADGEYLEAVRGFMKRRHNWDIGTGSVVCTGGVVAALNTAVRAFSKRGEGVIIQRPVYYPFMNAIINNGRKISNNALVIKNGRYEINFEELEQLAAKPDNKLMFLCSPHNPVGRVWTKEELTRIGEICICNGVVLISDEIHFDITQKQHYIINTLNKKIADNTVVCTAVSKSFNLAGLGTANLIIENSALRESFSRQLKADGYECINCVSRPATIAAYTLCDEWLDEMNAAVNSNFTLLENFIKIQIPEAYLYEREGTYLAWLDMSFMKMNDDELNSFLCRECGIIPDPGIWFGPEGRGFTRLNLASPQSMVQQALERMAKKIKKS